MNKILGGYFENMGDIIGSAGYDEFLSSGRSVNVLQSNIYIAMTDQFAQGAGSKMGYLTQGKQLPKKENIELIMATLSEKEKEEFLRELLFSAIQVVNAGGPEYIDALCQVLVAWEYTAMVESNKEFLDKLEKIEEEIKNNPSTGLTWEEVLGG